MSLNKIYLLYQFTGTSQTSLNLKKKKKKKETNYMYKYHQHHKKVCSREKWKNGSNLQVLTGVQNVHVHVYLYNEKIIAIMNKNISRYVSFFVLKLIMQHLLDINNFTADKNVFVFFYFIYRQFPILVVIHQRHQVFGLLQGLLWVSRIHVLLQTNPRINKTDRILQLNDLFKFSCYMY